MKIAFQEITMHRSIAVKLLISIAVASIDPNHPLAQTVAPHFAKSANCSGNSVSGSYNLQTNSCEFNQLYQLPIQQLKLSPESLDSNTCDDAAPFVLLSGNNYFFAQHFPYALVYISGKPVFVLDKKDDYIIVKLLRIFDDKTPQELIARIEDNTIFYSNLSHPPKVTNSDFIVYDHNDDEVFNLHYSNKCTLVVTGTFRNKGKWVKMGVESTILSNGLSFSHVTFGNLSFVFDETGVGIDRAPVTDLPN